VKEPQNLDDIEKEIIEALDNPADVEVAPGAPKVLPVIPLLRRPFFPGMAAPLIIDPGPHYETLKQVAASRTKAVCLLLSNREDIDPNQITSTDLYRCGVMAKVLRILPMPQGGAQAIFSMEARVKVTRFIKGKLKAQVSYFDDLSQTATKETKAYAIAILSTIKELLTLNPLFKEELQVFLGHSDFTDPGRLADFAVALTTATREELQAVLTTFDLPDRMEKALILLKKELDLSQLQSSINQKIEGSIVRTQREFFLREQLKAIKRELGLEKDDKQADVEKFMERLRQSPPPTEVEKVVIEELEKLQVLDTASSEYGVVRGYLDWLTCLPWGKQSTDQFHLKTAEKILEEDHYGLEDVKERIIEFLAVSELSKGATTGSIICLTGPPGVGKTSIGRSIARALGRKFYRFSVGGMRDESEIKGHRRTYVGAMPGKMIQALKVCQTMNPVIMLDEIDKLSQGTHGDPASALLEVLDPEQNSGFLDHYLDVPVDLSKVLFITTSNVLETIPDPLRDRMDILRLSGYILEEKVEIAKRYLVPKARAEMGLSEEQVSFTTAALKAMAHGYAREAGVRSLDANIKRVCRKVAVEVVKMDQKPRGRINPIRAKISVSRLEEYLGKPIYTSDRFYDETPVGVVTGLAWTALGGTIMYIEAVQVPAEKSSLRLTGQLGDVIKESAELAWTYAHSVVQRLAPGTQWFSEHEVHVHMPEGSVPKDGPSAGITLVTALLSLLLNRPVRSGVAMTGEITLTGKVLPIGGLKEKLIAARRASCNIVIFPKENLRDYDEIPEHLKKGLDVHFVDSYQEVYDIAFGQET